MAAGVVGGIGIIRAVGCGVRVVRTVGIRIGIIDGVGIRIICAVRRSARAAVALVSAGTGLATGSRGDTTPAGGGTVTAAVAYGGCTGRGTRTYGGVMTGRCAAITGTR